MDRRQFIKNSSMASGYFLLPGFLKPLQYIGNANPTKKLVVIQLSGGNDWLNTFIPFTNDLYYKNRKRIGILKDKLTPLNADMAMNNAMLSLKEFYDNGEFAVVNNVGYPNPDRSHFRSMDIWQTASGSSEILQTGWLGRYLDASCNNSYQAIELDNYLSLALKGKKLNGLAIKNINDLYKEINTPYFNDIINASNTPNLTEDNQGYLYKTLLETNSSVNYIYEKNKILTNSASYPNTEIGKQLHTIANFINSDLNTNVYYVNLTGFDTHVAQVDKQNKLLTTYSEAVTAFINNLKALNKWDDTLIFTFSEFGRRVQENASGGTDHGTAGNVLLFGNKLKLKGIVNKAPDLTNLDNGDLKFTTDFRSIYKNILDNWLNTDSTKIISGNVSSFTIV